MKGPSTQVHECALSGELNQCHTALFHSIMTFLETREIQVPQV